MAGVSSGQTGGRVQTGQTGAPVKQKEAGGNGGQADGRLPGRTKEPGGQQGAGQVCETGRGTAEGSRRLNPEICWLLAIFLLAVTMRTIAALSRQMIQLDEASYARMAQNLLLGHVPWDISSTSDTHLSILYPVVTASFQVMTRNIVAAGYIVSIFFSSLIILPVYLFGKVMWNNRAGMAAAALVAVLPLLVNTGSLLDGQNLFAFWIACAMFFGYRMQFTKRCMCGMIAGTSLGIAYLDDPTALYYLAVLLPLLVFIGLRQEVSNYANKAAAHFVLMFLIFAIPNVAYMTWQNGALTFNDRPMDQLYVAVHDIRGSLNQEEQVMGLDASGDIKLNSLEQGQGLSGTLISNPLGLIKASLHRDFSFYVRNIALLLPVWLLPLIGVGLHKQAWSRREALKYGYFVLMFLPLLTLPLKWTDARFMLPYAAIAMLWVGRGWLNLESWATGTMRELKGWRDGRRKRMVQIAVAVLVLVPVAGFSLWSITREQYPVQYRQAGEWLKANGGDGARLMSRENSSSWYAGADLVEMPYASPAEVVDYAHRNGAEYLLLSRSIVDDLRPQLSDWMDPQKAAASGLQQVYRADAGTGSETVIYKFT